MQHASKQNKRNKRGGAPQHDGEAFVVAGACKSLLNPRADAALSARLVGAVGVAEGRVNARALPYGEAWRAAVIANRCTSLLAAQLAPGSGTASDRSENEYGAPSKLPPDIAADAAHPGYGPRSLSPGKGKGRLGPCLNLGDYAGLDWWVWTAVFRSPTGRQTTSAVRRLAQVALRSVLACKALRELESPVFPAWRTVGLRSFLQYTIHGTTARFGRQTRNQLDQHSSRTELCADRM
jgi:hypothetical protein